WQPEQQVAESVAGERAGIEGELAEIVGAAKTFEVVVRNPPHVSAELHRVLAANPGEVVGELQGSGSRDAGLVAAERGEARAVAEVECRECVHSRNVD